MDALWIAVAMLLAVVGGWPVTAGVLKLAKSQTVRAVDAAESGGPADEVAVAESEGEPDAVAETPSDMPLNNDGNGTQEVADSGRDNLLHGANGEPDGGSDSPSPGEGNEGQPQPPAAPARPGGEVLRGGLVIGFLERGAVALAIFSGQPVAIAYVVAIKGLGRYPELKETPGASERFIIGTLASMLWAASVAVLVKVLLL